jgi:hypothetical protein
MQSWTAGYYPPVGPAATANGNGGGGGASTLGANFGFNLGHETFRVQVAITGLVIAAFIGLLLLHRNGQRFSVHVQ